MWYHDPGFSHPWRGMMADAVGIDEPVDYFDGHRPKYASDDMASWTIANNHTKSMLRG